MPTLDYLIKNEPESNLLFSDNSTVQNEVGICFFDPVDETLKEISELSDHILSVPPFKKALKKYYLILNPGSVAPTEIAVRPIFDDLPSGIVIDPTDFYSIKTIISVTEPMISQFDDLDNMNTASVLTSEIPAHTPIWMLIESIQPLNLILDISIEVEYE